MCDFLVNLDDFFVVICMDFHEVVVCSRYVPYNFFYIFFSIFYATDIKGPYFLIQHDSKIEFK